MGDEEKKDEKKSGGALKVFLDVIKLAPLGEMIHNVGGRKMGVSSFAIVAIWQIVASANYVVSTGLGLALLGIGIAAGGFAFATAWEDRSKGEKREKRENADA